MEIYILRDNQEFGPYSREAALEYIKQGIFEAVDQACYAGMTEWKPVGELLGIDPDSKSGKGPARGSAGKIAEFNPTWVHSNSTPRRRSRGGGIKSGLMIVLNVVLISILAMAAYIRWGGGSHMARHWLAAMSVELATLANAGLDNNATPAPVAGAPVIVKEPVAAESSPVAAVTPGAAPRSTPVSVAAPTPALATSPVAASTPELAAVAAVSPQPATTEDVAASPAPIAAQASAPALQVAAASPAPVVAPAPSPGTAVAAPSAPASEPDAAPSPNPAPASPPPGAAVLSPGAPAAAASPPAPPKPFGPADLAGNPSAWPKTLLLRQALTFPLLDDNSQVVGSVTEPTGTTVKLVKIQGDQLTLEYNGMRQTISWKQTDLAEEVAKIGSLAPRAQSVTGAPTAAAPSVVPAGAVAGTPAGN